MDLANAKAILNQCRRNEFRDHAFGDVEITWMRAGFEVASGYFNSDNAEVSLVSATGANTFTGDDAKILKECGVLGQVDRNDETGPDEFVLGQTMPGLTKEGVKHELIRKNIFDKSD